MRVHNAAGEVLPRVGVRGTGTGGSDGSLSTPRSGEIQPAVEVGADSSEAAAEFSFNSDLRRYTGQVGRLAAVIASLNLAEQSILEIFHTEFQGVHEVSPCRSDSRRTTTSSLQLFCMSLSTLARELPGTEASACFHQILSAIHERGVVDARLLLSAVPEIKNLRASLKLSQYERWEHLTVPREPFAGSPDGDSAWTPDAFALVIAEQLTSRVDPSSTAHANTDRTLASRLLENIERRASSPASGEDFEDFFYSLQGAAPMSTECKESV